MSDRMRRALETLPWLGAGVVALVVAPFWLLADAALDRLHGLGR